MKRRTSHPVAPRIGGLASTDLESLLADPEWHELEVRHDFTGESLERVEIRGSRATDASFTGADLRDWCARYGLAIGLRTGGLALVSTARAQIDRQVDVAVRPVFAARDRAVEGPVVDLDPAQVGAFRTPSLRNVAGTAPAPTGVPQLSLVARGVAAPWRMISSFGSARVPVTPRLPRVGPTPRMRRRREVVPRTMKPAVSTSAPVPTRL